MRKRVDPAWAMVLLAGFGAGHLQSLADEGEAVRDPVLLFEDRGQKIEIFARLRAAPQAAQGGRVVYRVRRAHPDAPLGPRSLGVVFNHTMHAQGYLTGEITFAPRGETLAPDLVDAQWNGLKKIVEPNVYEVVARTPAELKALLAALKARSDLQWVEVPVNYGIAAGEADALLGAAGGRR